MRKLLLFLFILLFTQVGYAEDFPSYTNPSVIPSAPAPAPTTQTMEPSYTVQDPQAENTHPIISQTVELTKELERYQSLSHQAWENIPVTKLKIHSKGQAVLLLRERLQATGDLLAENNNHESIYDKSLKMAVINFQTRHGLKADGVAGPATINELNVTPQTRIHQLEINIQRWQQLSSELPERYIMVIIPDFKLHLIENGHEVLSMKAIVGKPDWPTPELSSRVTRIVFNPFWNVPTNIAMNEVIPKAMEDPTYLDTMHIKVYVDHGDGGEVINHSDVDWQSILDNDHNPYELRQDPGADNSLGIVKFEFPNPYDVYLHDTPVKSLFDQDVRALSHGCIRLEKPMDLVSYLMKDDVVWNSDQEQNILESHKTTFVRIPNAMPIYITYVTAFTDENGVVNYRNDIYNRDTEDSTQPTQVQYQNMHYAP